MNAGLSETKVGLFTLVALAVMVGLFFWMNGAHVFEKGYPLEAVFDRIDGIRPGAPVKFVGVDIGRVTRVYFEHQRVVVAMNIQKGVEIPKEVKAIISSSGVVGDKFVEIIPLAPGEQTASGKRIQGQNPITMDEFYSTTYEVLASLKSIADNVSQFTNDPAVTESLKKSLARMDQITADIAGVTRKLSRFDLDRVLARIDNVTVIAERIMETNEPQINELVGNITVASAQLTQASITTNRFMSQIDNNGQTAVAAQQIMANIQKVSADLEKFSTTLASKGKDVDMLIGDAHQTMQSINKAAEDIDKAVNQLSSGADGTLSQVKQTIAQTTEAAEKVNKYVNVFDQIALKHSLGAGYNNSDRLVVDYSADLTWDGQNSLIFGLNNIGQTNKTTLQWAGRYEPYRFRAGLYKSQFGLGLDYLIAPTYSIGLDLYNTQYPNLGLTSDWQFARNWRFALSGTDALTSGDVTWELEIWRNL